MTNLIGLNGKKRSGKDTSGTMMSELLDIPTYSFAKPLKEMCSVLFNLTPDDIDGETKETTQEFQLVNWKDNLLFLVAKYFPNYPLPTDSELCDNFYRTMLLPSLIAENEIQQRALVRTSPRKIMQLFGTEFARRNISNNIWIELAENELKEKGALIVTDVRFDNEAKWVKSNNGLVVSVVRETAQASGDVHPSELGIDKTLIDVYLENNGTLDELKNGVEMLVEYKIKPQVLDLNDLL